MLLTLNFIILINSFIQIKSDFQNFYEEINQKISEDPTIIDKIGNSSLQENNKYEEYIHTFGEKIIASGFRFEEHKAVTEDGYILTIWRIPGKLGNYTREAKKPIILQHGLLDDSYTFLVLNINISLPIQLAREG